jgi:hypothetical protein
MVRRWREDEIVEEIERELRAQAEVAISRGSNLFLVFLRSALPRLGVKRASKLAGALEIASQQDVGSGRFCAYLRNAGGIEGAARERTRLRMDGRDHAPT